MPRKVVFKDQLCLSLKLDNSSVLWSYSSIIKNNLDILITLDYMVFDWIFLEKLIERIQKKEWIKHLIFWVVVVLSFIARDRILDEHTLYTSWVRQVCLLIPQLIGSYFLAYYWIPKYIVSSKKFLYILFLFLIVYITIVLARYLIIHVSETLTRTLPYRRESLVEIVLDWKKLLSEYFTPIYVVVLGFLFIKFFIHYIEAKQKTLQIDKEKIETELNLLKAQLNPHFLFNTLNNIYLLALENSSKTAYSIEKLSEILDYILYRCTDKYGSLRADVKMLENYIELEKLRYDDRLQVTLEKHIEKDINIAPLILLSFVENAFKHGAGEDSGSPKINILIRYTNGLFIFNISNTVDAVPDDSQKKKIGLANIKKQLDLLYDNRYKLEINNNQKGLFVVELKIEITDEN